MVVIDDGGRADDVFPNSRRILWRFKSKITTAGGLKTTPGTSLSLAHDGGADGLEFCAEAIGVYMAVAAQIEIGLAVDDPGDI